jgi:hypothetical protein
MVGMSKEDIAGKGGELGVIRRAQKRFEYGIKKSSNWRARYLDDTKFANADPDNGYQWPAKYWQVRQADERPALTINKTRQHNLNIVNDSKMNRPGIKFRAAGNGATAESARAMDGIARHIEYQSSAANHYDVVSRFQVDGGIGWLRVFTDYQDDSSFDQEIYITSIPDSLSVVDDPDAKDPVKKDSRWRFIFEDVPRDEFEQKYPDYIKYASMDNVSPSGWIDDDHVRVAEYFEAQDHEEELLLLESGQTITASELREIDPEAKELKDKTTRRRKVWKRTIMRYMLVGNHIVEEETKPWIGKHIPLVPVIGEEVIIEGQIDIKGHTRALKDPQRMYNYWASSGVEFGALQTKTPWITAIEAVEGFEDYWKTANKVNHAYLPYRAKDADGQVLPPPQRVEPPVPSPVALKGMEVSNIDMQMVSGQYENTLGQQGNERTGEAIFARQRQGDRATYHFRDNLGKAIAHIGEIILDLVPKIYDTERVLMILSEDGKSLSVKIDPTMQQAYEEELNNNNEVAQRILNPNIGKYEVYADVGPGWATRREEAFSAMTVILQQRPELVGLIGDILFRAAEFPMAEEAAERLRRMVPKEALGQGPTQAEQELMGQVQQLTEMLKSSMEQLAVEKGKNQARLEKREVDVYNAITQRLKVLGDHTMNALQFQKLLDDAVRESEQVPISDTYEDHGPGAPGGSQLGFSFEGGM